MNQDSVKRRIYLFTSNHVPNYGIIELIYSIYGSVSSDFYLRHSNRIVPNEVNVIIDEFSNGYFVDHILDIKKRHPNTKYIFLATEFITSIKYRNYDFGETFNFFGDNEEWKSFIANSVRNRIGLGRRTSYMLQRYRGFVRALAACDALAIIHSDIAAGFDKIKDSLQHLAAPPVVVYPEIHLSPRAKQKTIDVPFGFSLTGTATRHRAAVVKKLIEAFAGIGINSSIYRYYKFDNNNPVAMKNGEIVFDYDSIVTETLFNLNPPQRENWPYSSPMRILRAVLLGQIPVITKRFNDHEIEDVALLWDETTETAVNMVRSGLWDRDELVEKHHASIDSYNQLARQKNADLRSLLARL